MVSPDVHHRPITTTNSNTVAVDNTPVFISCDAPPSTAIKKPATTKKTGSKKRPPSCRRGSLAFLSRLGRNSKQPQIPRDDTSISSSVNSTGSVAATAPEVAVSGRRTCLKIKTQKESLLRVIKPRKNADPNARCRLWTDGSSTRLMADKASSKKTQPLSVRFGSVRIRTHMNILSDHPSVSSGPPIGLGWEIVGTEEITQVVDHLTVPQALVLSKWARERMLMLQGVTRAECRQAEKEAQTIQASRRRNAPCGTWLRPMLMQVFDRSNNGKNAANNGGKAVMFRRARHRTNQRQQQQQQQANLKEYDA